MASSTGLPALVDKIVQRLRRDPGLAFLLLAIGLAAGLYAPTLGYTFVGYDDTWLVRDNWIVQERSWSSLHAIFLTLDVEGRFTLAPEYLPIRDLSVMLDFAIWGTWFAGHHLTNLILYLAAIVLWFRALESLGIDRKLAGLAMLIWAVHPAHAESVAWLAERKGLLGVAFAGACALGYARFRRGGSAAYLAVAMITAVLAVWSKAHAAFAIGALAPLELVLPARISWRRSLIALAAIGIVALVAFAPVVMLARSADVIGSDVHTPAGRIATVLGTHGFYLILSTLVARSSVSYPLSFIGPTPMDIAIGTLALVVFVAVAVVPSRGRWAPPPALRVAAILWLVGWLPVSHLLVPLQMVFVADRYVLVPTLGLALAIAIGLARIPIRWARWALVATVVIASSLRTLEARSSWRDGEALWSNAVSINPDDGGAWSMYAENIKDSDRAMVVVEEGLRHSQSPRLLQRQALILIEQGRRAEGVEMMRRAAEAGEYKAMSNLALLLEEDQHRDEALVWARRAIKLAPSYAAGQRDFGKIVLAAGKPAEALPAFQRAYALEPKSLTNRFNLALALLALGRRAEARPHLEACLGDAKLGPRALELLGP